jgi:hypothetical protein
MVAAYTAGAIVNGITTRIFESLDIDRLIYKQKDPPSKLRAAILIRKPEAYMHIMKNFNDPRLLRSTITNVLLIGFFTFIHLCRSPTLTWWHLVSAVCLFIVVAGISAWAWYETADNFYVHLTATYDEVTKNDQPIEKIKSADKPNSENLRDA